MKCFDQVVRPLLYIILAFAGLPHGILIAYIRFQESLIIHHIIAGAVGTGHRHRAGIPQGYPLSMIFISLLLRAWMLHIACFAVTVRTLADDLMIISRGNRT